MARHMRMAAAGMILAVAVLCSCSSGNGLGPFGHPTTPGEQCIALRGATVASDGLEAVQNHGTATAIIDKVALRRPRDLQLVGVWAVPAEGTLFGAQTGYPPGHVPLPGWHWTRRQHANGAKVPHTTGKYDRMNLVLTVRLPAGVTRGRAAGVDMWYHVGTNHYYLKFLTALVVLAGPTC